MRHHIDLHHYASPSDNVVSQPTRLTTPGTLTKIAQVVDDAEVITGLGRLILTDQVLHKFKTALAGVTATVVDKTPGTRNLNRVLDDHITKIEGFGQAVEDALAGVKTQDGFANALRTAGRTSVNGFQAYVSAPDYKKDFEDIQSRIKTVAMIQGLAKVLLIIGAAAATGMAAGAWAGAALEGAGATAGGVEAGAFGAEVIGFTMTQRLMNQAIDGKNDTGLGEDLLTNALMMGSLKAAGEIYGKAFKVVADPKKYQTAYKIGGAATGFVALQAFAEVQTAVKTGKLMDGDDRMRSLLSNALMMGSMELGHFLMSSATKMPAMHELASRRAAKNLADLDGRIGALKPELDKVKAGGEPGKLAAAKLITKLESLWTEQLSVFDQATKAEIEAAKKGGDEAAKQKGIKDAEAKFKAATDTMNAELAKLDLKLAAAGIEVPPPVGGAAGHLFEPMKPGFVKFKPDGFKVIQDFYKESGGKLEPVPGKEGLFRGTDASGETFYAAEDKAESFLDKEATDKEEEVHDDDPKQQGDGADNGGVGGVKGRKTYEKATQPGAKGPVERKLTPQETAAALDGVKGRSFGSVKGKVTSAKATGPKTARVEMQVPRGKGETIKVTVEIKFVDNLKETTTHGGDSGPATNQFTRGPDGQWTGKIEIRTDVAPADLPFVIGHELTEGAAIAEKFGSKDPLKGYNDELEAGVLQPGKDATSKPTAHDRAGAQEIIDLYDDWKALEKQAGKAKTKDAQNRAARRKGTLDRALEAQGLNDPTQAAAKKKLLEDSGASKDLLERIKDGKFDPSTIQHKWNGPSNHGEWPGDRGNSGWIDDRPEVIKIVGVDPETGKANPIMFRDGRVDFSEFSQKNYKIEGLTGEHAADMKKMRVEIAKREKLIDPKDKPSDSALEKAERDWQRDFVVKVNGKANGAKGIRPHHAGGTSVEMIPKDLHKVQHTDVADYD